MPEFDSWQKLVSPLTCVVYFQHASDCVGVQIALVLQTYFLQTWLLVGFTKYAWCIVGVVCTISRNLECVRICLPLSSNYSYILANSEKIEFMALVGGNSSVNESK
jgi:hypothetical protein